MKRCWFGLGLLAALLALSILTAGIMERRHSRIAQVLAQAGQAMAAENWEQGAALSRDGAAQWEQGAAFGAAMLDHEPMEEIDSLLAQVALCLEIGDGDGAAQLLTEAAARVENIARSHRWSWWNFL